MSSARISARAFACFCDDLEEEDVCYGILLAAAFAYESDHHALQNVGQGHVVLEEGGEEMTVLQY